MKEAKKTFNDIKIGNTIYAYDYELNYGFKMKVTGLTEILNYNNDTYTLFICERYFDHKDYAVIIDGKEKVKTSFKDKNLKMIYFANEKDYNNKVHN